MKKLVFYSDQQAPKLQTLIVWDYFFELMFVLFLLLFLIFNFLGKKKMLTLKKHLVLAKDRDSNSELIKT